MKQNKLEQALLEQIKQIPVIDTHEHLPTEAERIKQPVDACYLINNYVGSDMVANAGLEGVPGENDEIVNFKIDLETRWKKFKPYWEKLKFTGYGQSVRIVVRDLFGFNDLDDNSYQQVSEKMTEWNKPGIYKKIFREKCNIVKSINDTSTFPPECGQNTNPELFVNLRRNIDLEELNCAQNLRNLQKHYNKNFRSLKDFVDFLHWLVAEWKQEGAVGVKFGYAYRRTLKFEDVPFSAAEPVFNDLIATKEYHHYEGPVSILQDFVVHELIKATGDNDLVAVIHTGLQAGGYNLINNTNPTLLDNLFMKYRNVKFDIFHGGMPFVSQAGVMAKYFPNVHLDMAWMHVISPAISRRALAEWLDLIANTKIMGFGGDYAIIEKVYGHLVLARHNIAAVLAEKIEQSVMNETEAIEIARKLFYQNPKELYGLDI